MADCHLSAIIYMVTFNTDYKLIKYDLSLKICIRLILEYRNQNWSYSHDYCYYLER